MRAFVHTPRSSEFEVPCKNWGGWEDYLAEQLLLVSRERLCPWRHWRGHVTRLENGLQVSNDLVQYLKCERIWGHAPGSSAPEAWQVTWPPLNSVRPIDFELWALLMPHLLQTLLLPWKTSQTRRRTFRNHTVTILLKKSTRYNKTRIFIIVVTTVSASDIILICLKPAHIFTSYFSKIPFNIVIRSTNYICEAVTSTKIN
jgi:hypothetical protein